MHRFLSTSMAALGPAGWWGRWEKCSALRRHVGDERQIQTSEAGARPTARSKDTALSGHAPRADPCGEPAGIVINDIDAISRRRLDPPDAGAARRMVNVSPRTVVVLSRIDGAVARSIRPRSPSSIAR